MSNKVELLKKIKALADNGIGGEKINAKLKLRKLMKELGITDLDLEIDKVKTRIFKTGSLIIYKKLFVQVVSSIIEDVKIYSSMGNKNIRLVDCTVSQQVEIEAKFAFYKIRYNQDLETFFIAFIQKNGIFPKYSKEQEHEEMTHEERTKYIKAEMMSNGLEKHHYRKQIEEFPKEMKQ